jgi:hypothetical protein
MPQRQSPFDDFGVMHGDNQPVAVVPDIENHKAVHIVGIGKVCPQLFKIPPSSSLDDFDPSADLAGGLTILLRRLFEALHRDDVHSFILLRNLRSVNFSTGEIPAIGVETSVALVMTKMTRPGTRFRTPSNLSETIVRQTGTPSRYLF